MPLRIVRRPRSPFWIMRGTVRGIRVEESTGTGDWRVAEEIRATREAELLTQSIYGRRATATFAEAALSYLEASGPVRFLEPVIRHFGTTPLARIDQDGLDKGARKLFPQAASSTRNRQFYTPASAVLWHAAKRGWCDRPIIERPKEPPARVRYLTVVEAERLLAACSDHLRPLVIFMLYTGARTGEALWLEWRDVDLSRAHVNFVDTKTDAPRGMHLNPLALAALANLGHRDGYVFRRPDGRPYTLPRKITDTSAGTRIKTAFQGAVRRAKLTDFHPHDCRHTWATWHYAANRDLGALMRLGGWKTDRMVLRYAHVNVGELAPSIDRLPGVNVGDASSSKRKACTGTTS